MPVVLYWAVSAKLSLKYLNMRCFCARVCVRMCVHVCSSVTELYIMSVTSAHYAYCFHVFLGLESSVLFVILSSFHKSCLCSGWLTVLWVRRARTQLLWSCQRLLWERCFKLVKISGFSVSSQHSFAAKISSCHRWQHVCIMLLWCLQKATALAELFTVLAVIGCETSTVIGRSDAVVSWLKLCFNFDGI